MKGQTVRLFDVLALGPFMVYAGFGAVTLPPVARSLLIGAGLGTIAYNGAMYAHYKRKAARCYGHKSESKSTAVPIAKSL